MKCCKRGARTLKAVALSAVWLLIAAISFGPARAETGTEVPRAPAASAPAGDAVFPSAPDPKYAKETPAKARMHTCVDQYNANKAANANGGLEWIEKGGGYYGECNKRLGGISSSPRPTQNGKRPFSKLPDGPSIMARNAIYRVLRTLPDDHLNCLYRNQIKLLCPPDVEFVSVEEHYKTKDYDLLVASMGQLGTGTRWHDWKLIVEDGKTAVIEPLAEECLECDIRVEKLNYQSNEIVFAHRQGKQLQTAAFRAGQFTLRKRKLDPKEPLDEDTCDHLQVLYKRCQNAEPNTVDCTMAPTNSGHFALLRIEDRYAGISYDGLQRMCSDACSNGKAIDRKSFFKKVCRRKVF